MSDRPLDEDAVDEEEHPHPQPGPNPADALRGGGQGADISRRDRSHREPALHRADLQSVVARRRRLRLASANQGQSPAQAPGQQITAEDQAEQRHLAGIRPLRVRKGTERAPQQHDPRHVPCRQPALHPEIHASDAPDRVVAEDRHPEESPSPARRPPHHGAPSIPVVPVQQQYGDNKTPAHGRRLEIAETLIPGRVAGGPAGENGVQHEGASILDDEADDRRAVLGDGEVRSEQRHRDDELRRRC